MKNILVPTVLGFLISCSNITEEKKEKYTKKGNEITHQLNLELSSNLIKAMKYSIENALDTCNLIAIPLTKKIEKKNNVEIKRISSKNRNDANSPNKNEEKILERYENGLEGIFLEKNDNSIDYYKPIYIEQLCLSCHGDKKDIPVEVSKKISELYPEDKAKGYSLKDFRGVFHIKFNL